MGSETLPSTCYILSDESSIPFYSTSNGYNYPETKNHSSCSVERQFYSDVYVRLKELYFQSVTINTHARRQRNCKVHPCFFVPSFLGLPPISAIKPPRPKILVLRAEFLTLDFPLLEFSGFFPSRLEPLQISSTYYYLPVIQPVFF